MATTEVLWAAGPLEQSRGWPRSESLGCFHSTCLFTEGPCEKGEVRRWGRDPKSPWSESEVTQLCLTLCDPVDCSLPGFSISGIPQARILEWAAISFFRGSSPPRDRIQVSHIAGRRLILWATKEVLIRATKNAVIWERVGKGFPDVRQNEREIKFIRMEDAVRTVVQLKGESTLNRSS